MTIIFLLKKEIKSQTTLKVSAYWHWISNVWLLSTSKDGVTTESIRDEVKDLVNRGTILVINASDSQGWSGFGQKKKFEWMHSTWSKKPESLPKDDTSL